MANKREETPDILGNVLDADSDAASGQPGSADESKGEQGRGKAPDSSGQEGGGQRSSSADEAPKRKATYYLREETLSELEELWFQLRQQAGEGEKRSVSKSAIVDAALQEAIDELNSEGEGSTIARRLLE